MKIFDSDKANQINCFTVALCTCKKTTEQFQGAYLKPFISLWRLCQLMLQSLAFDNRQNKLFSYHPKFYFLFAQLFVCDSVDHQISAVHDMCRRCCRHKKTHTVCQAWCTCRKVIAVLNSAEHFALLKTRSSSTSKIISAGLQLALPMADKICVLQCTATLHNRKKVKWALKLMVLNCK